jgi:DNA-binding response OmpR family regulator
MNNLEKINILIIDDSEEILNALCTYFTQKGHNVFCASNGLEGLKLLDSFDKEHEDKLEAVITDLVLPNISGVAVISIVKNRFPNIPVIAVTGWGEHPEALAKEARADLVLEKPFKLPDLEKDLIKLIEKRRLERNNNEITLISNDELSKKILKSLLPKCKSRKFLTPLRNYCRTINVQLDELIFESKTLEGDLLKLLNTNNSEIGNLKSEIKQSINFCNDLIQSLYNCYMNPKIEIELFDYFSMLNEHIDRLPKDRKYRISVSNRRLFRKINNDKGLVSQILFILFSNIHDFLQYSNGHLSISSKYSPNIIRKYRKGRHNITFNFRTQSRKYKLNNHKRIAIVDDDPTFGGLIKDCLLSDKKYEIDIANSAYKFFDNLTTASLKRTYDLIIMDILMEGMLGTEALETLRKRRYYSHVPILIISGHNFVNSVAFKKAIYKFKPIEVYYKGSFTIESFKNIAEKMLSKKWPNFDFKSLCSLSLCNSIFKDHILHVGFYPMEKSMKLICGKIIFKSGRSHYRIVLNIHSFRKEDKWEVSKHEKEQLNEMLNPYLIDLMNSSIRHDIKNKINALSQNVIQLSNIYLSNETNSSLLEINKKINNITYKLSILKDKEIF